MGRRGSWAGSGGQVRAPCPLVIARGSFPWHLHVPSPRKLPSGDSTAYSWAGPGQHLEPEGGWNYLANFNLQ
jgi:hypothetical protein